jgi:N-hydroxyarylamine O-acetyltransferase
MKPSDNETGPVAGTFDLCAYLDRIGYTGPCDPTQSVLATLVKHHMAAIPFEAIDVLLGRGVDLAPAAIDRKLLANHRGGYCFEHASLTRRALQAVGFPVEQHLARVMVQASPNDPPRPATHTSLRVKAGGQFWLVDTGFGSFTPNVPLAWQTDSPQHTDFGTFRLVERRDGYRLESLYRKQWSPLYEILDFNWQDVDFKVANHYTASHPDSRFRNVLMVARTAPRGRTTLAGNRLKRVALDGSREEYILDADGLSEALVTAFGLPVEADWLPLLDQAAAGIFSPS